MCFSVAWRLWEDYTRKKAESKSTIIYVITGTTPGTKTFVQTSIAELHRLSLYRLIDETVVPNAWYKLLIWQENGIQQAEYIYTKHENKENVSLILLHNYLST